ncbi:succinate dehydrogenase complex, subunit B, partial [Coemansia sp. RSA 455]
MATLTGLVRSILQVPVGGRLPIRRLGVQGLGRTGAPRCMATERPSNLKSFKIYRWNPDTPTEEPRMQEYKLDLSKTGPM